MENKFYERIDQISPPKKPSMKEKLNLGLLIAMEEGRKTKFVSQERIMASLNRYKSFTAETFVCERCNNTKKSKTKVLWETSSGSKTICNGCYGELLAIGTKE